MQLKKINENENNKDLLSTLTGHFNYRIISDFTKQIAPAYQKIEEKMLRAKVSSIFVDKNEHMSIFVENQTQYPQTLLPNKSCFNFLSDWVEYNHTLPLSKYEQMLKESELNNIKLECIVSKTELNIVEMHGKKRFPIYRKLSNLYMTFEPEGTTSFEKIEDTLNQFRNIPGVYSIAPASEVRYSLKYNRKTIHSEATLNLRQRYTRHVSEPMETSSYLTIKIVAELNNERK